MLQIVLENPVGRVPCSWAVVLAVIPPPPPEMPVPNPLVWLFQ